MGCLLASTIIFGVFCAVSVNGQLEFNTPIVAATCLPVLITWNNGTAPYNVSVFHEPSSTPQRIATNVPLESFAWASVNFPAGTSLWLEITDSVAGSLAKSPNFVVQPSSDQSCLSGNTTATSGSSTSSPSQSGTSDSLDSTASSDSPPPSGSANPQSKGSGASSTHDSKAAAIAGGVVGGIVALVLLGLVWRYVRRPANVQAQPSRFDIDQFSGKRLTQVAPRDIESQPWEQNDGGLTHSQVAPPFSLPEGTYAPTVSGHNHAKNSVVMRWDPPTGQHTQNSSSDAGLRSSDLEERVQSLERHIASTTPAPPYYTGNE
ncbi:hypothetical protein B0H10DRAFT_2103358 [Mycena sp. CBHHK59/15]|nr:hypothetical protein B0H10DRAFT_2103358 [Mycena sp. CBHHK59/15]